MGVARHRLELFGQPGNQELAPHFTCEQSPSLHLSKLRTLSSDRLCLADNVKMLKGMNYTHFHVLILHPGF